MRSVNWPPLNVRRSVGPWDTSYDSFTKFNDTMVTYYLVSWRDRPSVWLFHECSPWPEQIRTDDTKGASSTRILINSALYLPASSSLQSFIEIDFKIDQSSCSHTFVDIACRWYIKDGTIAFFRRVSSVLRFLVLGEFHLTEVKISVTKFWSFALVV